MAVRISPSIAISVGIHLLIAGGVWLFHSPADPPPEPVIEAAPIEILPATSAEPELTGVAVLDQAEIAKLTPATINVSPPATIDSPAPPRITPRPAKPKQLASATVVRPEIAPPAITHSAFNDMRKGRDPEGQGRVTINVSPPATIDVGSTLDRIASVAVPGSVVETPATGDETDHETPRISTAEITPGGHGTYKIDDLTFKGRINKDGTVSIKDKANLQHQFTSWQNVKHVLRTEGPFGLLRVNFDVTDAVMRRHKADPYASRKLKLLDETRDTRVAIGNEYRRDQLEHTTELVIANLEIMWASVKEPPKRKQALFELWDEVFDGKSELELTAAKQARAAIIGFIRTRFPAGSANAFTQSELVALNAKRQSKTAFAPYE